MNFCSAYCSDWFLEHLSYLEFPPQLRNISPTISPTTEMKLDDTMRMSMIFKLLEKSVIAISLGRYEFL